MNRIMQVYFGNNCFPYKDKERKVAYPIVAKVGGGSLVCGENNTTKIRFYTTRIGGLSNTWIANLKMPNGRKYNRVLATTGIEEDEFYVDLDISDLYTQIQGEVIIGLNGFEGEMSITEEDDQYIINGTPSIVSTYVIKVMVNYAPLFLPIGDIEPDIVQQILALIATKLNITNGIVVMSEDTDLTQFENGQVLLDKETGKLYKYNGTTLVELELDLLNFAKTNKSNTFTQNQKLKGATLEFENSTPVGYQAGKIEVNTTDSAFDITAYQDLLLKSTNGNVVISANSTHSITINGTPIPYGVELQTKLVSGTNIKTINGQSILGSGNINIGGAVDSVNGKTGVVVLNASDIYAQNAQTIQRNLERLDERIDDIQEGKTKRFVINFADLCGDNFATTLQELIAYYEEDPTAIKVLDAEGNDISATFFGVEGDEIRRGLLNSRIALKTSESDTFGIGAIYDDNYHRDIASYILTGSFESEDFTVFKLYKLFDEDNTPVDIESGYDIMTPEGIRDYWFDTEFKQAVSWDAGETDMADYARKDTTNTFTQDQTFNGATNYYNGQGYKWRTLPSSDGYAFMFQVSYDNGVNWSTAFSTYGSSTYFNGNISVGSKTIYDTSFGSTSTDSSSTTYSGALTSNQEKVFTQPLTSLTITSLTQASGDDLPRYECSFVVGANMTITLPSGVVWKMGTPTLVEGDSWTLYIKGGFAYLC